MHRWTTRVCVIFCFTGIFTASAVNAATGWVQNTKVTKVSSHHELFGGCMAYLSKKNTSLDCSQWITFDCTGELDGNTKSDGNRKFNSAQLALVTGNKVKVQVTDSKKINGQCFATRVDVFNQ